MKSIRERLSAHGITLATPGGEDVSFIEEFSNAREDGSNPVPILVLCGPANSKAQQAARLALGVSDEELEEESAVFETYPEALVVIHDGLVDTEDRAEFEAATSKAVAFANGDGPPFYLVIVSKGWVHLNPAAEKVAVRSNLVAATSSCAGVAVS